MTIVVEIGNAASNSECYISVADADIYHASIGNSIWTNLLLAEKEQALRRAANYMTQYYRLQGKGTRVNSTQALDWPRWNVQVPDIIGYGRNYVLQTEIPIAVMRANADLALIAAAGDLNPAQTERVISEQVGPLKVQYDPSSPQNTRYVAVHALLAPYLSSGSGMARLVRC